MNVISDPALRLLRLPDVLDRLGMRRSWFYREIAAGRAPQPAKVGRVSCWRSDAIDTYIASLVSKSQDASQ